MFQKILVLTGCLSLLSTQWLFAQPPAENPGLEAEQKNIIGDPSQRDWKSSREANLRYVERLAAITNPATEQIQRDRIHALAKGSIGTGSLVEETAISALKKIASEEKRPEVLAHLITSVQNSINLKYDGEKHETFLRAVEVVRSVKSNEEAVLSAKIELLSSLNVSPIDSVSALAAKELIEIAPKIKTEALQKAFIEKVKKVNWEYVSSTRFLKDTVSMLAALEPANDEIHDLRAAPLFLGLAAKSEFVQDFTGQKMAELLKKAKSSRAQIALFPTNDKWIASAPEHGINHLISALAEIKPVDVAAEASIIDFLGNSLISDHSRVRDASGTTLCTVAACTNPEKQAKLIERLTNFNKNYPNGPIDTSNYILLALEALSKIKPANDDIKRSRIEGIAKVLGSEKFRLRDKGASLLKEIALKEKDAVTQLAILKNGEMNWKFNLDEDLSLKLIIEGVVGMEPVNDEVKKARVEFLKKVAKEAVDARFAHLARETLVNEAVKALELRDLKRTAENSAAPMPRPMAEAPAHK